MKQQYLPESYARLLTGSYGNKAKGKRVVGRPLKFKKTLKLDNSAKRQDQLIQLSEKRQHDQAKEECLHQFDQQEQDKFKKQNGNQQQYSERSTFRTDSSYPPTHHGETLMMESNWTQNKLTRAKELFQMFQLSVRGITIQLIAKQLSLNKQEVAEAWLQFQKDRNLTEISKQVTIQNNSQTQINKYYISKLVEMLQKDGTLTLLQMKTLLNAKIAKQDLLNKFPPLTQTRIAMLLRKAGYTRRKFGSIGSQKNTTDNIIKRMQFCKLYKVLKATKIPIYFYHQTQLSKNSYKNYGWAKDGERVKLNGTVQKKVMIRCILSSEGIASWLIRFGPISKYQFQQMLEDLKKNGDSIEKIRRKFLIVDKRAICNKEEFCEVVQENSFDTICLPPVSLMLNPIDRWFTLIHNEIKNQYYASKQDLMKKGECILLQYNPKCIQGYLKYLPQQIQSWLSRVPE